MKQRERGGRGEVESLERNRAGLLSDTVNLAKIEKGREVIGFICKKQRKAPHCSIKSG